MTLTPSQLQNLIKTNITKNNGSLVLNGQTKGLDSVNALINKYIPGKKLTISGATSQDTAQGITVNGKSASAPFSAFATKAVFTAAADAVNLQLTATLADASSWTFSKAYAAWKTAYIDKLKFTGSLSFQLNTIKSDSAPAGLSLDGALSLGGPLNMIADFFSGTAGLAISGAIDRNNDLPTMVLASDLSTKLDMGPVKFPAIQFKVNVHSELVTPAAPSKTSPYVTTYLSLEADLPFNSGTEQHNLQIKTPYYDPSLPIAFQLIPDGFIKAGIKELEKQLLNGESVNGILPKSWNILDDVNLSQLDFTYDPTAKKVIAIGANLVITENLVLIPQVFELDQTLFNFHLGFAPKQPTNFSFGVAALVKVGPTGNMQISGSYPDMEFHIFLEEGAEIDLKSILAHFKVKLPGVDFNPSIEELDIQANFKEKTFSGNIATHIGWTVPDVGFNLVIEGFYFGLDHKGPGVTDVKIGGNFEVGTALFFVEADYADSAWLFKGGLIPGHTANLTDFAKAIADKFGLPFSAKPPQVILETLAVSFSTSPKKTFSFEASIDGSGIPKNGINLQDVKGSFSITSSIDAETQKRTYVGKVEGDLIFGTASFVLTYDFDTATSKNIFKAKWQEKEGQTLGIADIASAFGVEITPLPPGVDLALTYASFEYQSENKEFTFEAHSDNYGTIYLDSEVRDQEGRVLIFTLNYDHPVTLSQLPLFGPKIPDGDKIGLNEIALIMANAAFPKFTPPNGTSGASLLPAALIDEGGEKGAGYDVVAGVSIAAKVALPTETKDVYFVLYEKKKKTDQSGDSGNGQTIIAEEDGAGESDTPSNSPGIKWINVQKTIGPINFQKFGFGYKSKKVQVLFQATLSGAGLEIGLDGLGIGFTLSKTPKFSPVLNGLSLKYQSNSILISGALLKSGPEEYSGDAIIKVPEFMLSALGSFARYKGHNSVFVYAVLDIPLGGPPIFLIQGIAAGFGFNRNLVLPTIDKVTTFPLVEAAFPGNKISQEQLLNNLRDDIPPEIGQYWLAVGVNFSSFELINSFAMVSVEFGNDFVLALLGVSRVSIPPNLKPDQNPIAYAEIALEAIYDNNLHKFSIQGKLTDKSYVLSQSCQLTGGFAFFIWFAGEHGGDFVLTIGGYRPHFKPPAYYPKPANVPRLGLNWQVSSVLTIKGGAYFALLPHGLMVGGYLSVVFATGPVRAWLIAEVDFELDWKPFYYYVYFGIDLGIALNLHIIFFTIHISLSLGVDVTLQGPPFGGKITVHLWIISFTIHFGENNPEKKPITWGEFKTSFLPGAGQSPSFATMALTGGESAPPTSVCLISASDGVIKDFTKAKVKPNDLDWVFNPAELVILTKTLIPAKTAGVKGYDFTGDWNTDFGIQPMDLQPDDFTANFEVEILDEEGNVDKNLFIKGVPVVLNVPKAMWLQGGKIKNDNPEVIPNALIGIEIVTIKNKPDYTLPINLKALLFEVTEIDDALQWTSPKPPTTDDFDQAKAMQTMQKSIDANPVGKVRSALLDEINNYGLQVDTDIQVGALAAGKTADLIAAPLLSYLGEQKTQN